MTIAPSKQSQGICNKLSDAHVPIVRSQTCIVSSYNNIPPRQVLESHVTTAIEVAGSHKSTGTGPGIPVPRCPSSNGH